MQLVLSINSCCHSVMKSKLLFSCFILIKCLTMGIHVVSPLLMHVCCQSQLFSIRDNIPKDTPRIPKDIPNLLEGVDFQDQVVTGNVFFFAPL